MGSDRKRNWRAESHGGPWQAYEHLLLPAIHAFPLSLQEMERLQAKGEIAEEELRALEEDVTGKVGSFAIQFRRFCDKIRSHAYILHSDHASLVAWYAVRSCPSPP